MSDMAKRARAAGVWIDPKEYAARQGEDKSDTLPRRRPGRPRKSPENAPVSAPAPESTPE